jgi:hypothetical protein
VVVASGGGYGRLSLRNCDFVVHRRGATYAKTMPCCKRALMGACHGRAEGLGVVASERRTRRPGAGRNRPWIGEPRTVGSRHAAWRLPSTLPRGRATLTPRRAQPRQPGAVVSEQDLRTSTRAACPTDSAPAARRRLHRLPPQSPVSATAARPYPSNLGA